MASFKSNHVEEMWPNLIYVRGNARAEDSLACRARDICMATTLPPIVAPGPCLYADYTHICKVLFNAYTKSKIVGAVAF